MFPTHIPGEDFINSWYPILIAMGCGLIYGIRNYFKGPQCQTTKKMTKKTVIVTGANSGMGKEITKDLANRGARVIMACRDIEKGAETAKDLVELYKVKAESLKVMHLDLESFASVRAFVKLFKAEEGKCHVLYNNAGVNCHPPKRTVDGHEVHLQTNYLGAYLLTSLLLDTLKASAPARIINTSALAYQLAVMDWDDVDWENKEFVTGDAYAQSKMAIMLWTHTLSKELEGSNVTVNVVQPGVVNSDALRHMPFKKSSFVALSTRPICWFFMKTSKDGAQCAIHVSVATEEEGVSGKYYSDLRIVETKEEARDEEACARLAAITKTLISQSQKTVES